MKYLRGGLIDGFAPFVYEGPSTGLSRLVPCMMLC